MCCFLVFLIPVIVAATLAAAYIAISLSSVSLAGLTASQPTIMLLASRWVCRCVRGQRRQQQLHNHKLAPTHYFLIPSSASLNLHSAGWASLVLSTVAVAATSGLIAIYAFATADADLSLLLRGRHKRNAFAGKVVWVTGASQGLGAALAMHLSQHGAKVVLSARSEDKLQVCAWGPICQHTRASAGCASLHVLFGAASTSGSRH